MTTMADVRRAPDMREPSSTNGRQLSQDAARPLNEPRSTTPSTNHSVPIGARGYTRLFRNHEFLRLWMAQMISQTIMNAANYGMIFLVTKVSNSSFATSGAIVAFSLPALFLSIPAGVLVDRFDRRLVLWVSNVLRALASAVFVLALLVSQDTLWPVYALTFFIAMVGQFFTPAEGAAIPRLVRRSDLMNALALFNITFTVAQAAGLILVGPLALVLIPTFRIGGPVFGVTIEPVVSLFAIVTVFYLVCAALILSIPAARLRAVELTPAEQHAMAEISGIRRREPHPDQSSASAKLSSIYGDIAASWRFIRQDTVLNITVWQLTLAGVIISVVATIAPRFVHDYFHLGAELMVLVLLPAGVGLVLGSVATPNVVRFLRYTWTIALGVGVLAASTALLVVGRFTAPFIFGADSWWTAWPYIITMLALTFLIGIGIDFINIPAQTIVQERSPDWIKGRVLAVQYLLLYGATVVYVPIIGWLADHIGLSATLMIVAVTVAGAGGLTVYLRIRTRRRANGWVGRRPGAPPDVPGGAL
jgi:MFS family permease